ncbi:lipopolysaccharide biosynthesis protein [Enterovirga rhinocerotis]|uniref:O-antigen/teichoic acid export membrane protein n=1 Tax=Enterovirga rhinocerotis TaxID=1339210 RepID=A0A4R7BSS9_9HYPH|nr:lipopolysaccharide biosynthesis protein [Enterovirga rhinocerotis]TDR87147.1 O-antigen/teichoic acid export membrane protein [Enterovirga rhinocerotis]
MTLVAIFLVNAGLAFALSLVLASLLGPDAFGRYAIAVSITLVIYTGLFEWLRLSTARFYSRKTQTAARGVRSTLDLAYWVCGAVLGLLSALVIGLGPEPGLSRGLLAAAAFCGLAYGFSEYRLALSRALFLERPYVILAFTRAMLGFLAAAGLAYATREPAYVLGGFALATLLPILLVRGRLADPHAGWRLFERDRLLLFARYAVPLVAASALYQLLPLINRTVLASRDGFTEAGYFALVSELTTRLFQNLGAALDLVLFQLAVRAEEQHGREEAERQVARNAGIIAAIVIPAAAGLWLVWPAFEAIFIPQAFRGHLDGTVPLLVPALAGFALLQYALNPFFQLRHRTAPVVMAALAAVVVNVGVILAWPRLGGSVGFAAAQIAGVAAGLAVLLALAIADGARLPWRDFAVAMGGAAAMTLLLLPTRGLFAPVTALLVQVAAGGGVYLALALAFDLAGCRTLLRQALNRRAGGPGTPGR